MHRAFNDSKAALARNCTIEILIEFGLMKRDMSGFRAGTRTSLAQIHLCLRTLQLRSETNLWHFFTPSGTHSKT